MEVFIKCICLLLAIIYGFSNVAKFARNQTIHGVQIFLMAVGIVGFIYFQFWR